MPSPNLTEGMDEYTHSVRIGVQLTATAVLLDVVVPTAKLTTSRAKTLHYITIVSQLILPFAAMDPQYVFNTGSQLNIAFPEKKAPTLHVGFECRDKYTLALSQVAVWIEYWMAAWVTGEGGAANTLLRKLHDLGG